MEGEDRDKARRKAHAATRDLLRGVGPSATIRDHLGNDLTNAEIESLHGRLTDAVESEIKTTLKENDT